MTSGPARSSALADEIGAESLSPSQRDLRASLARGRWVVASDNARVVVPPQVAIVGAGRIAPRIVAVDGQPVARRLLPLSLTFDHRAVTGGEAARFLGAVITDLQLEE